MDDAGTPIACAALQAVRQVAQTVAGEHQLLQPGAVAKGLGQFFDAVALDATNLQLRATTDPLRQFA